ncbi:MAG TPA: hypothetical protein VFQ80_04835 [Thermomicrobiales bacterium]|jgi:hypothetical protein|nr:hypothetical protein [Thermomicrobiales bacterium]
MKYAFGLLMLLAAAIVWRQRNSAGIGEWLRRLSDAFTNALLLGTSGFERDGRDPAKAG